MTADAAHSSPESPAAEIPLITATAQPRSYWSAGKVLFAAADTFAGPDGVVREVAIRAAPWSLELYPTMACSIACHFCYAQTRNADYHYANMPVEMMDRLHASIAALGIRGVQYCGGGEPLQWRGGRVADYIAALPIATTRAGMASNMLRGSALARPEVLERMTFLEVNVCGFDDASYQVVTGSSDGHSRMAVAVRTLLEARSAAGLTSPSINAKILISNRNHRWLRQMYEFAARIGFDNIHLRLVDDYEHLGGFTLDRTEREELRGVLVTLAAERGLTSWSEQVGATSRSTGDTSRRSRRR